MSICQKCNGSGIDPTATAPKPGEEATICPDCGGNGKEADAE